MALQTFQAPKLRSAFPKSSLIAPDVLRDGEVVDPTQMPEDGEFVIVRNDGQSEIAGLLRGEQAAGLSFHEASISTGGAKFGDPAPVPDRDALGLRMIWGNPRRADVQSLGKQTYFNKAIDVEIALFNAIDGVALNAQFVPGSYVTVAPNYSVIQGGAIGTRLVLQPTWADTAAIADPALVVAPALEAAVDAYTGWVVGTVKRAPSSTPFNGAKIVISLFDKAVRV